MKNAAPRPGHEVFRHCERKRSNQKAAKQDWIASSLTLLAMTTTLPRRLGRLPAAVAGRLVGDARVMRSFRI
jgi:hypothetical protein